MLVLGGDIMDEIWKDIHFIESNGIEYDFTGLYQISNLGRVKSIEKNGAEITLMVKF